MIKNAVIHISNEQPLLADLPALPTATDACLICTNLRTLNGSRPVFIDRSDSTFLFPLVHVRFVEIHADDGIVAEPAQTGKSATAEPGPDEPEASPAPVRFSDELDDDLLRRIREA